MAKLQVPVTEEDHKQGNESAAVTLVEYGDFQCPDAGAAYAMVKRLQEHFGQKLRFVFRNFPLTRIHPMAVPAAETAEFAGANGKFWEMHDALFEHQESLSLPMLLELAVELGLDEGEAEEAIVERQYLTRIRDDVKGGERSGVHGTPTFFINGEEYQGAWEYGNLAAEINEAI